jgi:hypothetical protein
MGMLDRIKKRQLDGFKEFVLNMETTSVNSRQHILMTGIVEDPIFMTYVMKNVRTFDDFLTLPIDEINLVLRSQEQIIGVFAKCVHGTESDIIGMLEGMIPKYISKLKDELSYLKEVSPSEREAAKYFMLKAIRKLQIQESIQGFRWHLPPQDLFRSKVLKDGKSEIYFESGILAAEGEILKGRRSDFWKHFYDSGKLMAEGEYIDGLKSGVWVYYYGNGNIKSQGKYKSDQKHGKWKEWDRVGVVTDSEYCDGAKKT